VLKRIAEAPSLIFGPLPVMRDLSFAATSLHVIVANAAVTNYQLMSIF
jgi:hypothetical protein